jgi:cytochrome P450
VSKAQRALSPFVKINRRNFSHGFTDEALRDQEPILTKYFDSLIQKLRENCAKGPVDLSKFFNLVTVDIIGDLTFGQSFDCLENSAVHVSIHIGCRSAGAYAVV